MNITIKRPRLTSYQKDFLYNPSRFTITEASTKVGKTFSHLWWIYERAHETWNKENYNHWWVAPVYAQAEIAFKRLKAKVSKTGLYKINESKLIITTPSGVHIHFKSAEKPDNLYGEDVYSIVFDEAPRGRVEAWYALRSTITATKGIMKMIGNFKGIANWMHKLKEKSKTDPEYSYFKITAWQAVKEGILELSEVEQARKDLPEKIFKELYEAESSEDEGQLIMNESIIKLFSNTHIEEGIKYITGDIARLGRDKTILFVWSGFRVIDIVRMDVSTVNESVDAVKALREKHNVNLLNIIVDEDGVGGGVKDYVRCQGFVNNSRPVKVKGKEENFANLKTQCYYKLAEQINRNEMYVDCDEETETALCEELEMIRLSKELDANKITLISKDEVKKKIGRSPDYSDSLMMRMFFEINPNKGKYSLR